MLKRSVFTLILISLILTGCEVTPTVASAETPAQIEVEASTVAESPAPAPATEDIIALDVLKLHMEALTSDAANGRLVGTPGNQYAQDYIIAQLSALGIVAPDFAPDYQHPFEMVVPIKQDVATLSVVDGSGKAIQDFVYGYDFMEVVSINFTKGIGTLESAYTVIDTPFALADAPENTVLVFSKSATGSEGYNELFRNIERSGKKPRAVLYVSEQQNNGYFIGSPYSKMVTANDNENGMFVLKISQSTYDILNANADKRIALSMNVAIASITANNVIGFLPGATDEGYIVCGHFDHLGANLDGTVNTGALDNASGVASMLALAEALAKVPDRTLSYYFIAFNGEEAGLWGSEALAASGLIDAAQYKVVNLDMLGASNDVTIEVSATAYASEPFANAFGEHMQSYGFEIERNAMGRSDHFPMEQEGFIAVGMIDFDNRFYHTPFDTIDLALDYNRLKTITEAVYQWIAVKR